MKRTLGLVGAFLLMFVGGLMYFSYMESTDPLGMSFADPYGPVSAVASEPATLLEPMVPVGPKPPLDAESMFLSRGTDAPRTANEILFERLWTPDLALDCQTYSSAPAGCTVMADWKTWTVDLYGADGIFVRRIAWPGDGIDEVKKPRDVLCVGGCVYVCDTGNRRIQVYNLDDGSHEGTFTITALTGTVPEAPECLYQNTDGSVTVETDQRTSAVIRNGRLDVIVRYVEVPNRPLLLRNGRLAPKRVS
ncbi:MAG: hypothetical protein HY341_03020 [Candidatus Kerfeldbacteria bacterium]|nr:hypothetical protein [Candidatus Kerfeldbacteria bacterium]